MSGPERPRDRLQRKLRHQKGASPLARRLGALFLKHAPYQLTCSEFESFVLDYYEGHLTERQRSMFDFHMRMCAMCEVHFRSYVKAIELGQRLCQEDELDQPAEISETLVAAIVAARREAD